MDAKLKIFAILLMFICLCKRGAHGEQCSTSDLHVDQTTRHQVGGYQEYAVEVNNTCICTQTNVKLLCPGFNSSIRVDPPSIISPDPDGNLCTLVNGGPVTNSDVIKFNYAWTTKFSLAPVSSNVACS